METTAKGEAWLQIVNLNKLVFDNVYLNQIHALKRFELKNTSQFPLMVKLRSNLQTQISFQLRNENLPQEPDSIDRKSELSHADDVLTLRFALLIMKILFSFRQQHIFITGKYFK